ncbi:MAG: DUF2586 family protein, partial [Treponemataceae bacterium]
MGLANIKNTVLDGQLGSASGSSEGIFGFVGVGENATEIVILSSSDDLKKLPNGELKETLCDVFDVSSPRIYALCVQASTESRTSSITKNIKGTGSLTIKGIANNRFSITGFISKAGRLGSAKVTLSINGIEKTPLVIPKDGQLVIEESGLTLNFADGEIDSESFELEDSFSFTTTLPLVSNGELLAAVEKLLDSKRVFESIVVATETDKSFWAMLSLCARKAFEKFMYLYFVTKVESKKDETLDEYVQTLIGENRGSVNDYRVSVCAGDFLVG